MNFDSIFQAFWTQYRADDDPPASTDPEYTVALRLANEALNHWATYDGTYWRELFTTNQLDGSGAQTITTADTTYSAATNFREAGGNIKVKNSDGKTVQTYPIIEPHEAQFKADNATYAYFSGNLKDGYTLNLNPAPPSSLNGLDIDYVYYKTPTEYSVGATTSEIPNAYFIVHRILANRFRASRNPYYEDALRDAENILAKMKLDNESGTWANPWSVADNSGSNWGG